MSKAITIDNLGFEASVEWARALEVADAKYITEVPFVPRKTQQAIIDQMTPSQMEQLCDLRKSPPWAAFTPSKDYAYRLKSLFQGKLIPHFDLGASMERLDAFFEEGEIADEEEADKLYGILQQITDLDKMAEEILLNLLSCLKS